MRKERTLRLTKEQDEAQEIVNLTVRIETSIYKALREIKRETGIAIADLIKVSILNNYSNRSH